MRSKKWIVLASTALAGVLAIPAVAFAGSPGTAGSGRAGTVEVPVSFTVHNTNHTTVACTSDGRTYTVRGHLTAPAAAPARPDTATLYLHAVTQGEFYWDFKAVPGYDYAEQQAQNGNVSITIDRLGYGASDKPPGNGTCLGSQADVAHQIVDQMRSGHYSYDSGPAPAFPHVFLGGHSAGGLIATIEAYSFHNIDGLINEGWADQGASAFTATELLDTNKRCLTGGDAGTPGYAQFGLNGGDEVLFHSATPEVRKAVAAMVHPDPCGDIESFPQAIAADVLGVPLTRVPVLIIFGDDDALFPPPSGQLQAARYLGNGDVTLAQLPNTAHGIGYEATHLQTVDIINRWLQDHHG